MHHAPADLRNRLHERFHGPLMSFFLRRLKNRAEAEDLTQEVFARVVGAGNLERVEHAEAFVFKIAINLLRDRKRQEARGRPASFLPLDAALASELESQLVEDLSPERVLIGRDSLADALHALEGLEERTRNIFVLFRLENMKQKDIAAFYGIAQSTVEKHVMKAVLHLAVRYGRKRSKHEQSGPNE